ncbi:MAG: cupredoxin domain-containing protein, partial [Dehalococcoidia bacterium]|nr:cupredoxin domain-containing protein [Dehalococcoidia bacterium]
MVKLAYVRLAAVALVLLALSPSQGWATVVSQPTVNVSVLDYRFDPVDLMILAGTTVVWTNDGNAPHTITSGAALWDSGTISSGQTFSRTFDTPGTFPYHCIFHQGSG